MSENIVQSILQSRIPALLTVLGFCLLLAACQSSAKDDEQEKAGMDNGLAYRVVDTPVEDGRNKLLQKYNFNPEAHQISESVPSSTDAAGSTEDTYIPPSNRSVMLRTSQGDIEVLVHADWAPRGAARFVELVEQGYFDGAAWFNVNENFAQTGIAADPEIAERIPTDPIERDPMHGSNTRGMISFVQINADPDTRSTQFFINKGENPQLDGQDGVAYHVPFAEVKRGMTVVDKLFETGNPRAGFIEQLAEEGVMAFRRQYPAGDTIEFVRLMD